MKKNCFHTSEIHGLRKTLTNELSDFRVLTCSSSVNCTSNVAAWFNIQFSSCITYQTTHKFMSLVTQHFHVIKPVNVNVGICRAHHQLEPSNVLDAL